MDIYGMRPVNKTAGIVTFQSGATDSFLLDNKEQLKRLGQKKKMLQDSLIALRDEIGIVPHRGGKGASKKYPAYIVMNPKFKDYKYIQEKLTRLDKKIFDIRREIEKEEKTSLVKGYTITQRLGEKGGKIYQAIEFNDGSKTWTEWRLIRKLPEDANITEW